MEFEPLKGIGSKKLTLEEVQTFTNELEALSSIKGTYAIRNIKKGEAVMLKKGSRLRKLKTRSELEIIEEPEYEYPTKAEGGYICNCLIRMYQVFNKEKNTKETFVFVEASVSGLYGTTTDRISNNGAYPGVYYDDISCCARFDGCLDYGTAGYGFIKIYYNGCYNPYYEIMNQINWSFRE